MDIPDHVFKLPSENKDGHEGIKIRVIRRSEKPIENAQSEPIILVKNPPRKPYIDTPISSVEDFQKEIGANLDSVVAVNGEFVKMLILHPEIQMEFLAEHIFRTPDHTPLQKGETILPEQAIFIILFHHLYFLAITNSLPLPTFTKSFKEKFKGLQQLLPNDENTTVINLEPYQIFSYIRSLKHDFKAKAFQSWKDILHIFKEKPSEIIPLFKNYTELMLSQNPGIPDSSSHSISREPSHTAFNGRIQPTTDGRKVSIFEEERMRREREREEREEKEKEKEKEKERERVAKERIERERVAKEKAERERVAKEKAERERVAKERIEKERVAKERIEKERVAKEKAERERIAKEKATKATLATGMAGKAGKTGEGKEKEKEKGKGKGLSEEQKRRKLDYEKEKEKNPGLTPEEYMKKTIPKGMKTGRPTVRWANGLSEGKFVDE